MSARFDSGAEDGEEPELAAADDLPDAQELFLKMQGRWLAADADVHSSQANDELPDSQELFLRMQQEEVESHTSLPDPRELFLRLEDEERAVDAPSEQSPSSSVLPEPRELFLRLEEGERAVDAPSEQSPGSSVLPDPRELFLRLEDEERAVDAPSEQPPSSSMLPDPRELFLRLEDEERAVDAPSEQPPSSSVLPDPRELFLRLEDEEKAVDAPSEQPALSQLASPAELFLLRQGEPYAKESEGPEHELPALPDLDVIRAELEAEERARLDPDLLGDLSGPERFVDTISDTSFREKPLPRLDIRDIEPPQPAAAAKPVSPYSSGGWKSPVPLAQAQVPPASHPIAPGELAAKSHRADIAAPIAGVAAMGTTAEQECVHKPLEYVHKPQEPKSVEHTFIRAASKEAEGSLPLAKAKRLPRMSLYALSMFTRQLAAMLKSGISLVHSLEFAVESDPASAAIVSDLAKSIESGHTFSSALKEHPQVFSPVYFGLVQAGEASGHLVEVVGRLADILENELELRKKMTSVLTYPLVLLFVSLAGTLGFIYFILPQLTPLFDSLNVALPWPTRLLIGLRSLLIPMGILVLVLGVVLALSRSRIKGYIRTRPLLHQRLAYIPLSLPVIGEVYRKIITARVLYSLAMMLEVGMVMSQALTRVESAVGNAYVSHQLSLARKDLVDGLSVVESLGNHNIFPQAAMHLIAAGEESARLVEMFKYVSNYFEEEVSYSLDAAASTLEPLIMAIMGAVVGFIVIAAALPTIKLLQGFT